MEGPLETVVELQVALDELRLAEERLHGIPEWMRELHEEHAARKAEIEELDGQVQEAASERRAAEAQVQDCQEKLRTFQQQIGLVRNQKEYGALLQEIDGAKNTIAELEERALEALERQEGAGQKLAELRESFRELDERYAAELAKWEAEKPEVAGQVEALHGRIDVLRERLPRPVLVQFDRILERHGGQALAPVRKMRRAGRGPQILHCGSCNYRVRPQAIVEITNLKKVVYCDSCKRILYLGEAES